MPKRVNYESAAHFRVPSDFMDKVHAAAESRGLSAAGFMRMAIMREMNRIESNPLVDAKHREALEVNFV